MVLDMRYLSGSEANEAMKHFQEAASVASGATCERRRYGSVVVSGGKVIGRGFNSPPANREDQRRCSAPKDSYDKKVTDKTCCMHAEQRAVMDALRNNPDGLSGSRIYVTRLDADGLQERLPGKIYCTVCSKMALDSGIKEFALLCEDGIRVYDTAEYNTLSFQYTE